MAYRDIDARRRCDLQRFHRRNEARRAAGLCLKCGKTEPAPERTLCEPCLEKRRAADRARSARLRAEGKPRRDPVQAKRYERERSRRQHAERKAAGICTKCGRAPARPERTLCEPCAEQHRARDRTRHAQAKAQGIPYGGRDPEARRRAGRKRSRRRSETRRAAGLCIRCGNVPPEEGRAMCEPCREDRRVAKRARHAERRAAGLCVHCAAPAPGGKAYCEPCAVTRSRRRDLKAKRDTDCCSARGFDVDRRHKLLIFHVSEGSMSRALTTHCARIANTACRGSRYRFRTLPCVSGLQSAIASARHWLIRA